MSMKLADKGRFAPPPTLKPAAQRVSEAVAAWDGIHARTHWLLGDEREVDGADFYLGENEVGHIHLDSEAHVVQPRIVADLLIKAGLARRLEWSRSVVVFAIDRPVDVEHAIWLFQLSYDRRRGATTGELVARVEAQVAQSSGKAKRSSGIWTAEGAGRLRNAATRDVDFIPPRSS
jgi:hypothetical protein